MCANFVWQKSLAAGGGNPIDRPDGGAMAGLTPLDVPVPNTSMHRLRLARYGLVSVSCHTELRTHSVLHQSHVALASLLSQRQSADPLLQASDSTDLGHLYQNENSKQLLLSKNE